QLFGRSIRFDSGQDSVSWLRRRRNRCRIRRGQDAANAGRFYDLGNQWHQQSWVTRLNNSTRVIRWCISMRASHKLHEAFNRPMEPTPPDLLMSLLAVRHSSCSRPLLGGVAHLVRVRWTQAAAPAMLRAMALHE